MCRCCDARTRSSSDPTVCRLVGALAGGGGGIEALEAAVNTTRKVVRQRAWVLSTHPRLESARRVRW